MRIGALLVMTIAQVAAPVAFAQAQSCGREQAAVTSARAALQSARDELRNLEAELARETEPAVRKSIEKLIRELKTRTIPDAERALQAAESALAARHRRAGRQRRALVDLRSGARRLEPAQPP